MPDIGRILKEEIKRLAHRALRAQQVKARQDIARIKRAAAHLRKENARLALELKKVQNHLRDALPALSEKASSVSQGIRLGPKLVLAQRRRLGLSREEFAKLLGVSAGAVVSWEGGKSRPRDGVKPAFAAVRKLGKRSARERLDLISKR